MLTSKRRKPKMYVVSMEEIETPYSVGLMIDVKYGQRQIISQWIWQDKEVKK